ncbi:MAG: hypothetical protein GXO48_06065 [Chlorobi bacterium]|nr:hypothetical protein [Chlorobiota bacterium]
MNLPRSLTLLSAVLIISTCRKDPHPYKVYKISQYDLYGVAVYQGDTVVAVGGRKYDEGVLFVKAGRRGLWQLKQRTNAALNTVAFRYGWRGFSAGYLGIILSGYGVWDTTEMLVSPSFSVFYDILDLDTIVYFVGGGEGFLKGTVFRARPGFDWFEELYLPYVLRSICFDGKYLYAGSVGRIYVSTNGRDWDSIFIGKDLYVDRIHHPTQGCYFIGTRGTIAKASRGKVQLIKKQPPIPLRTIVASEYIAEQIIALTGNGTLLVFDNNHWKVLTTVPSSQCFDIACGNENKCYMACETGKLYVLNLSQLF